MANQPIRWDTIQSRGNGEAFAGMNSGNAMFNNGISQLQNVLRQSEDIDTANFQNQTKQNTMAFQDAVAKYRSPEELKAAMDSGELDQLRASLGPNIDRNAIRGAADQRMVGLMQNKQQEIAFNHLMTDERVAPLLDQFKQATLKGDKNAAAALEAQYGQMGGRNLAGLAAYSDERANQLVDRSQKAGKYNMDIRQGNADIAYKAGSLANDSRRLGLQETEMGYQVEARLAAQVAGNLERMQKFASMNANSEAGQQKINQAIDSVKDPDVQTNMRRVAAEMAKGFVDEKGVKTEATVASVLKAFSTVDKRDWFTNGDMLYSNANVVEDAVKTGKTALQSRASTQYQQQQAVGFDAAQKDYENSTQRLERLRQRLDGGKK